MSRGGTLVVVAASFAGAALAAGVMWVRMTAEGFDYSQESWALIPVVWAGPLAALMAAARRPLVGALMLAASALAASSYFADVWGFIPGAVIFGCAIELGLSSAFGRVPGGNGVARDPAA